MMILISGQPGNGKTLRALALMLEEYERNHEAVKAGKEEPRRFFTNIAGATKAENENAFDWVEPIPFAESEDTAPEHRRPDWRLCPDGSYVLYDEAHADGKTEGLERYGVLFPGTGKPGEADDPRIKAMSTHRHRGFDLVFMTQWPSKVHHTLRQLVGKHLHMNRAMGLQRAGTFTWSRVQADPYDEKQREKAEEEIWAYPKALYGRYASATLHTATYKFKVPGKVWSALCVAVVLGLITYGAYSYSLPGKGSGSAEKPKAEGPASAPLSVSTPSKPGDAFKTASGYAMAMQPRIAAMPWTAPAFDGRDVVSEPRVFCMASDVGDDALNRKIAGSCTCLTEQGTRYAMPVAQCVDLARNGESYNPFRRASEERREARGAGEDSPAAEGASAPAPAVGVGESGFDGQQAGYGEMRPEPTT